MSRLPTTLLRRWAMVCATRSIPARSNEQPWHRGQLAMSLSAAIADGSVFTWKDFSRFVQVAPVERGWLVLWGHYRDAGRTRELVGQRTYVDLDGVRRRIADSVFELTRNPLLVAEAMVRFDSTAFAEQAPIHIPDPL